MYRGTTSHGCMTSINTDADGLGLQGAVGARRSGRGGGTAYYVYDASGQRARKVIERTGTGGAVTRIEERIYLGGFEVYRESPATAAR